MIKELNRTWLETWWQENLEKTYHKWVKNMKIFVFNVNTHQKVILAEDDFNYQVI